MKKLLTILLLSVVALALTTGEAYACRKVTVRQNMDWVKVFAGKDTKYVINQDINLGGKTVKIGEGSTLVFQGGSLDNGVVVGDNTKLPPNRNNIFHSCIIEGSWAVKCAYSSMFDGALDASLLLQNMSRLSKNLFLKADRQYNIDAEGKTIKVESISSDGAKKPTICFHTTNPNVVGIMLEGENISLDNLVIKDDYNSSNDSIYGKNDITIGSTIGIKALNGLACSLLISRCDFMGSTSSSYVASSQVRTCIVTNCAFSGAMADHAVYCSTKIESYEVINCLINDVVNTSGLFKVRSSRNLKLYSLKGISAHNLNGYMSVISLLATPQATITIDEVRVTKDSGNESVFYGFCITDETKTIEQSDLYNAEEIRIINCSFEYGYSGSPIIYPGSGKRVRVRKITFFNSQFNESNFGGAFSDYLCVDKCYFNNFCGNQGVSIVSRIASISNSTLTRSNTNLMNNLFSVNYSSKITDSISLETVTLDVDANSLFQVGHSNGLEIKVRKSDISTLSRNVLHTKDSGKVNLSLDRLVVKKKGTLFKEIDNY